MRGRDVVRGKIRKLIIQNRGSDVVQMKIFKIGFSCFVGSRGSLVLVLIFLFSLFHLLISLLLYTPALSK
jgi:hypothetical protein